MTSPETRRPTNGDFVTLKEYIESRISAIEKAIQIANEGMQVRLAGMNEFRDTLKDQASRFITRDEVDIKLDVIKQQIRLLEISKATLEGKASQSEVNSLKLIAIIGIIISIISLATIFLIK